MFDCLVFVIQEVKGREEQLVSSRQPLLMLVFLLTFVPCWLYMNLLKLPGYLLSNDKACAQTWLCQGLL